MQILIITNLFKEFQIGGYEIGCCNFAKYCEELGYNIKVLTSQLDISTPPEAFECRELKLHENWGFKQVKTSKRDEIETFNVRIIEKYLQHNYDKIFVWNGDGLGVGSFNFLSRDPRVVFYFCDRSFFRYKRNFNIKNLPHTLRSFRKNRTYANMSEGENIGEKLIFCSQNLAAQLGHKQGRLAYVGYKQFHSADIVERKSNLSQLVYVGQLTRQKGIYNLVEHIRRYNESDMHDSVTLTVYAKHANPDFVEDDMITFKYDVPYERILTELPHYDIAVFPSIWQEPFGFVMAEYADSGLPILTSGRGGSKEIYDMDDLYVFDPENYDSFAASLQNVRRADAEKLFIARVKNKEKLRRLKWSNLFEY